jgi:hypothetical protein
MCHDPRQLEWKLLRFIQPRAEVGILIPVGCLVPLAIGAALLIGAGMVIGAVLGRSNVSSDHVVVRVIDDGAKGGPAVLSTQIVPLR